MTGKRKPPFWVASLLIVGIAFFVSVFSFIPSPAYAENPPAQSGSQGQASNNKDVTCAVKMVGWILCPIINQSSRFADKMFNVLADNFLQTDPALVSSGNQGTMLAWEIARNLANVMFIVVFVIIILSQATGQGLSNYGIKRMLPRLIVAAIAVNVSYYICQLAVDVTNIMGYEIQNAMEGIANSIGPSVFGKVTDLTAAQTAQTSGGYNSMLQVIAASALAVGGIYLLMGPLAMVIISAAMICLTVIIIMMLRKAMIVLLVVISPVAFVMYLLPNTERLFQKWYKMFLQLLMVFPVVSLLFGAGQLASTIILVSHATAPNQQTLSGDALKQCDIDSQQNSDPTTNQQLNPDTSDLTGPCQGGIQVQNGRTEATGKTASVSWQTGLVATGVAIAPLVAVFAVLRGALSAAGAIGGWVNTSMSKARGGSSKLAGVLDKRKGENVQAAMQRLQARSLEKYRNPDKDGGGIVGRFAGRSADRQRRLAGSKSDLERQQALYLQEKDPNTRGLSEEGKNRAAEAQRASTEKRQQEELQAASLGASRSKDEELTATIDQLDAGKLTVDDPQVAAAIDELGKRQNWAELERIVNKVARSGESTLSSRVLSQTLSQNAGEILTGNQIAQISRGQLSSDYRNTITGNLNDGILTAEKAASAGPSLLGHVSDLAATSQMAQWQLAKSAAGAKTDPILSKKIGRNESALTNFSQGKRSNGSGW